VPYPVTLYLEDPTLKCSKKLVKYLTKKSYFFTVVDRTTPESVEMLKHHGHMYAIAPVLQINAAFFYGNRLYDPDTNKLCSIAKKYLKEMALRNELMNNSDSKIGVEV